jgi:hypothetical protein
MSVPEGQKSAFVEEPVLVSKGSEMQVDIKSGINYVNSYVNSETPQKIR